VLITSHAYQSSYGYNATPTQPAGQPQSQWQNQQGSTALASSDGNSTALKAKDQPKMVQVRFWLKFHVDYGQTVRIIGGHDQMGEFLIVAVGGADGATASSEIRSPLQQSSDYLTI
jgi:hypothetical protein